MRIGFSHRSWAVFVVLATGFLSFLYLTNFHPEYFPSSARLPSFFGESPPSGRNYGGTPLGLIFGSLAYLVFLFASALGIRKKRRTWPIGSVQFWLRAHIWLTVLTIPLVLLHCAFHSGGTHTTWLMVLYSLVMGSGFFGIALQQFMPRLMKKTLPREVVFEQIPHFRTQLLEKAMRIRGEIRELENVYLHPAAQELAVYGTGSSEPIARTTPPLEDLSVQSLAHFLDVQCLPYLAAKRGDGHALGDTRTAEGIFRTLKLSVAGTWRGKVEELEASCDDRRLTDLQTQLQHWLHGWLLIHVPASFALLIFTTWHACVAVRFLVRLQ